MTTPEPTDDLEPHRDRRRHLTRNRRILNNVALAHRLAADRATDPHEAERLLGHAMVGLVDAADSFDATGLGCRFGAYAEPRIASALERGHSTGEVQVAQARIAAAISSEQRIRDLAVFLDVPLGALVGGLMDATARTPVPQGPRPGHGLA